MKIASQHLLSDLNTLAVPAIAPKIYYPATIEDLIALVEVAQSPIYVIGEGSNTLFLEEKSPILIKPSFSGIDISESENAYKIKVGAAENWHSLVLHLHKSGIYGLENLALIPGTVGAAPVQNIGAYGREICDFIDEVDWFDLNNGNSYSFSNEQCYFGYRNSYFKNNRDISAVITRVTLSIPKNWQAVTEYAELKALGKSVTADEILNKVIEVRQRKLPDPNVIPNAGSFFKNPIISKEHAHSLLETYPDIPTYPINEMLVKVAAGWLIDKAGLKGAHKFGVATHKAQALVIVNPDKKPGKFIAQFAEYIQSIVKERFDISLEPEVRYISQYGENVGSKDLQNG